MQIKTKATMTDFIVRKEIIIDGELSDVWDALTNPEKTKRYFFHCKVFSDWKVGSSIIFKGKIFLFKKIELKGTIQAIEPEKLLKYTLQNSGDSNSKSFSIVTDELSHIDGKTILNVSDDVGRGEGAEKRYKRSMKGWDHILQGLKQLVEERNASSKNMAT
jgi:uncharacterized protein YndB with AHSA1/START domain